MPVIVIIEKVDIDGVKIKCANVKSLMDRFEAYNIYAEEMLSVCKRYETGKLAGGSFDDLMRAYIDDLNQLLK